MGMRIVSLPPSLTFMFFFLIHANCFTADRMGCDSMHQQDHQNLQKDGILKQEISSPSNIMDIYLPPRNPNSPPSIDWDPICNGMMLSTIGKNPIPYSKVIISSQPIKPTDSCLIQFSLNSMQHQDLQLEYTSLLPNRKDIGGSLRIEGRSFLNSLEVEALTLWICEVGRMYPLYPSSRNR